MVKKNLFSKVLAGVLAAGMVVTMLPGMSMRAEAVRVTGSASATIQKSANDTYVRIFDYDELSSDEKALPYTIEDFAGEEWNAGGTLADGSGTAGGNAVTFDPTKELNLLVVPTTWMEFESDMKRPDYEGGLTFASGKQWIGAATTSKNDADLTGRTYIVTIPAGTITGGVGTLDFDTPVPLTVQIDVNVGEGVTADQLNFEPQRDRKSLPSGTTTYWVRYVPSGYEYPDPEDNLGQPWTTQNDAGIIYGTNAGDWSTYNRSRGHYEISKNKATGTWLPVKTAYEVAQTANLDESYGAEILLSAERSTNLFGDFRVSVQAESNGAKWGTEDAGKTANYKSHELVDFIDPARSGAGTGVAAENGPQTNSAWVNRGIRVNSAIRDYTNYIGIRAINDAQVFAGVAQNPVAAPAAKAGATMAAAPNTTDIVYRGTGRTDNSLSNQPFYWFQNAEETLTDYIGSPNQNADKGYLPDYLEYNKVSSIEFVINPVNILRAYVFGWANNYDGDYSNAANGNGRSGNRNVAGVRRYGNLKHITINLGTEDNARAGGAYKFENGTEITDPVSVRNIYRYMWVFRSTDGYRFDMRTGNVWDYNSLATEPVEWPYDDGNYTTNTGDSSRFRGYQGVPTEQYLTTLPNGNAVKEGDTVEFMVKFDPLCDYSDAEVVAIGYDGGAIQTWKVDWNKETGMCKFTFGNQFPYRFTVQGVKEKKPVTLAVIPEKDYIFEATHTENFETLINNFYGYTPFFLAKGDLDMATGAATVNTCNYANPRFQIFTEAHEEDIALLDLVAFARRQVVGGAEQYFGHSFPSGKTKFKIRFNDTFTNQAGDIRNVIDNERNENRRYMHGSFDLDRSDDRYGKGPDFKLLVNGKAVTVADDDTFEIDLTEDTKIEVEGIVRKYYVYMPKLSGFNFELDPAIEQQREEYQRYGELDREQGSLTDTNYSAIDFRSSVIEGGQYKFKLKLTEAAANSRPVVKADTTVLTPDAEGWYSFEVNSDTFVTVDGITVNNAFRDTANLDQEEQDAIAWLLENNMTVGDGDGNFMPNSNTRRGDFVLMLYRYYGQPSANGTGGFSDVASNAYYANAVAWGSGKGIINGYPDGTFRPNNIITRAEVANILCKLCGLTSGSANPFTDVNEGDWFYTAVNRSFAAGIVKGMTDTTFVPNAGIMRAHYALMLYRSHNLLPAK